jgi:N-acetylglutamate synthase-like GNAT family acetyltransferase
MLVHADADEPSRGEPRETRMKAHVRKAKPIDAAALADLLTQLGYASQPEQVVARLTALESPEHALLVAEVEGTVVGMVHVSRWATMVLDNAAEIGALVVADDWRSQGIGHTLLDAAEQWAMQRGCSTLQVRTNIVRQRAHEFYYQNGFRQIKTSLTLVKEL